MTSAVDYVTGNVQAIPLDQSGQAAQEQYIDGVRDVVQAWDTKESVEEFAAMIEELRPHLAE